MAAASESQGLKIAVAVFVTLTVILAVTTYFGFSNYSKASADLAKANQDKQGISTQYGNAKNLIDFLKQRAGYAKLDTEDPKALHEQIEDAIKKDDQRLGDQLTAANNQLRQMIDRYRTSGGKDDKVNELGLAAGQIVAQVQGEPNKTYQSTQERLMALVDDLGQLNFELTLDNEDLRASLASVDSTNAKQLQVQIDELKKKQDDLLAEHERHEQERQNLLRKNDELNTGNAEKDTEIARLNQQIIEMNEKFAKVQSELTTQMKFYREEVEKKQDVMDVPDGYITYVDYNRNEVMTNITRRMGAHERMQLSVFDRNAPGLPTDKPKGVIELVRVTDTGSIARIVETKQPSQPIRYHDQVYSPAWSPNSPQRFAFIGKIDVDRDGRDDRADLKRLIEAAGGIVDFDLPLPPAKESGKLSAQTAWYVVDERDPYHEQQRGKDSAEDDKAYVQRRSEVLREAHSYGVRPISIERLLAQLGYKFGRPIPGSVEAIDRPAIEKLLNPKGVPTAPATPPAPAGETPAEEMPAEPGAVPPGGFGTEPGAPATPPAGGVPEPLPAGAFPN